MNNYTTWATELIETITHSTSSFTSKELKKYKVGLIRRLIEQVDKLDDSCEGCQEIKAKFFQIVELLSQIRTAPRKEKKQFKSLIEAVSKHLREKHRLYTEGYFISLGMIFGLIFGAALGSSFGNISIGPGVGLAFGLGIGAIIEESYKKDGRII